MQDKTARDRHAPTRAARVFSLSMKTLKNSASPHFFNVFMLSIGKHIIPVRRCDTILTQAIGLMFSRRQNALFTFSRPVLHSIHSFFCLEPLQLLFIDENHRIIEQTMLKPWRCYLPKNKYLYLIELSTPIQVKTGQRMLVKIH